jgi:hypothetical protein
MTRDDYEDYMQTERANEESEVDKEMRHRLLDAVPAVQRCKRRAKMSAIGIENLRCMYDDLSAGDKQYLANKLWKEDHVCPQKLRDYIPSHVLDPVVANRGDRFKIEEFFTDETYILSEVAPNMMCLIGLGEGNRLVDPIRVENVNKITAEEMCRIAAGRNFIRIPKGGN